MNFLASSETSAAATRSGSRTKPAENVDPVAHHQFPREPLGESGAMPPVSLRMNSSFLPAIVSPCCFT